MARSTSTSLTERTRVVASQQQLSAKLSGEAVILGLRDNVYYGLDGAGARLWDLAQQQSALGEIAAAISREYDVSADTALRDVLALATDLLERGLLDVVPDPAA